MFHLLCILILRSNFYFKQTLGKFVFTQLPWYSVPWYDIFGGIVRAGQWGKGKLKNKMRESSFQPVILAFLPPNLGPRWRGSFLLCKWFNHSTPIYHLAGCVRPCIWSCNVQRVCTANQVILSFWKSPLKEARAQLFIFSVFQLMGWRC